MQLWGSYILLLNECVCPGHELRLECTVVGVLLGVTALVIILGILFTIFIFARVILAKGKARTLKKLQTARESTQKENATYEEINLTPLDIGTTENVAYGHLSSKHVHVPKTYLAYSMTRHIMR